MCADPAIFSFQLWQWE